ncbi:acyl-CoA thioesterase domain-containing protein, partial [Mycobacterium sp. NAZ190054]|uniref:acyl-CoA thioesterase domain-containing protein n=1 Tax=Mycobacterium sp. NAZ190054 TaxID=1747766 RepID=UPI00350FDCED
MSTLGDLLDVTGTGPQHWRGRAGGPAGKRAYGGQLVAQSLAAAARTVDRAKAPTAMHLQFLRGGEAGEPVDYRVQLDAARAEVAADDDLDDHRIRGGRVLRRADAQPGVLDVGA